MATEIQLEQAAREIQDLDWGCGCCSRSSDFEMRGAIKLILRRLLNPTTEHACLKEADDGKGISQQ